MLQIFLKVFKCICQNFCTHFSPLYQIKPRFCSRFKLLLLPCVTLTVAFGNTNFATCGLGLDTSYVCGTWQFTTGSESRFFSKYWQDCAMTKLKFEERSFIEKRHSIKKKFQKLGPFCLWHTYRGGKMLQLESNYIKIYSNLCHVILDKTSILSRKFSQISRFMSNEKPI